VSNLPRQPNQPFQEGGEWRSYDSAGRLLRWDERMQAWVPVAGTYQPPPGPPAYPQQPYAQPGYGGAMPGYGYGYPYPVVPGTPLTKQELLFGFRGRINRSTWWGWSLLMSLAWGAALGTAIGVIVAVGNSVEDGESASGGVVVAIVLAVVVIIVAAVFANWIQLALGCKRFHDQDKSGWMQALGFIPWVGGIVLLIFLGCIGSTPGPNRYGTEPGLTGP
jgi:uncharacterized membrane protein YhaH (DUF805 family)